MQTYRQEGYKNEENEVDFRKILTILWQRLPILILVAIIAACIGLIGTILLVKPTYSSSFTAYVNNHNDSSVLTSLNSSDVSTRQTLANTAAKIATSDTILSKVAEDAGVDRKDLTVTTSVDSGSSILQVRTIMKDRETAYQCAKLLETALQEETARIVEGSSMQIIDKPKMSENRYSPSYAKNTILAGIIGFVIISIIVLIIRLKDDTMNDVSEIESKYGIPLVGSIPDLSEPKHESGYGYYAYASKGKEEA